MVARAGLGGSRRSQCVCACTLASRAGPECTPRSVGCAPSACPSARRCRRGSTGRLRRWTSPSSRTARSRGQRGRRSWRSARRSAAQRDAAVAAVGECWRGPVRGWGISSGSAQPQRGVRPWRSPPGNRPPVCECRQPASMTFIHRNEVASGDWTGLCASTLCVTNGLVAAGSARVCWPFAHCNALN